MVGYSGTLKSKQNVLELVNLKELFSSKWAMILVFISFDLRVFCFVFLTQNIVLIVNRQIRSHLDKNLVLVSHYHIYSLLK